MSIAPRIGVLAGVLVTGLIWASPSNAAELIMMEQPGCVWCKRWNEEIGVAYPNTQEGQRAPLRRVDITDRWPQDLSGIARERLTPTFVLVDNGVEIARLRGYPGEHFFWPLLDGMLEKLPEEIN
ncbi:transcriptional regulator [Labrenzia sp. 011]|uniref:transcriptional regulator n=1 Tax=Labrenzia sp. 011 TaxID=2171494 RepID=UPI000D522346|nr:transcriptional regulator [Labrenzia sp. 011]PVB62184.1 transcriptional regulator [Labrenzia sp. 011]